MIKEARIIFLRHGEEPDFVKISEKIKNRLKHEDSIIGLTLQGAVRAYCMPTLIKKILGESKNFQLHTYTNYNHKEANGKKCPEPVSRSYYTSQLLRSSPNCKNTVLYNKSEDVYELVENIKTNAKIYDNIIICWEHGQIPLIIQKLLDLKKEPSYNKIVKKFFKNKYEIKKETIKTSDLSKIQRSANAMKKDNNKTKNELAKIKDDMYYAPVWDVKYNNEDNKGEFNVYPGLTINTLKNDDWNVNWYL